MAMTWTQFLAAATAAGVQGSDVLGDNISVKNFEAPKFSRYVSTDPATPGLVVLTVTN
jgi:hypothetical protein